MTSQKEQFEIDFHDIIINGLGENIRQAEEAMALSESITANMAATDRGGVGYLFSKMQLMLQRYAIILVTRLFEPEEDGFESFSIPVALNYLRFHADYVEIRDRETILKKLISFGHEQNEFENIPEPWITQLVRKEFADRLPQAKEPENSDLDRALYNLKRMRDKITIDSDGEQEYTSMSQADRYMKTLLIYASDFIETVGKGYLGITPEKDNNMIDNQLKHLLNLAHITE